ncbi:MAG: DNA repair protein RadC [Proteobacteria bacterium]|nr:DNA repair protein RadC [Pseudomonadota bacterium]
MTGPKTSRNISHKISQWPEGERPRERLLKEGPQVLSDAELVAILLRNGTVGQDAISLSRNLLMQFGSLRQLLSASVKDLCAVEGIGPAKASQLLAALEIGNRQLKENILGKDALTNARAVYDYLTSSMRDLPEEVFKGIFLNNRNEVLEIVGLSRGTLDSAVLYPRDIVKRALELNASRVIIAHNHPGGSLQPSHKDIQLTVKIQESCRAVNIELLDHIIIGRNSFYSMRHNGDFDAI